jgi:hypothetical protein
MGVMLSLGDLGGRDGGGTVCKESRMEGFQGKTNGFDCVYSDVHKGKTACFDTESTHYGLLTNSS